jgi:DNA-binding response OmpR family regulator
MYHSPRCRILLVEQATPRLDVRPLRKAGHLCRRVNTGAAALDQLEWDCFDLMLFEPLLSDMSGAELVEHARARRGLRLRVLALTASDDKEMAIVLDQGADDCLPKSAAPGLLLAKIGALARRMVLGDPPIDAVVGHLIFLPEEHKVQVDGESVILTAKEYALGLMMCRNIGAPLERDQLRAVIWASQGSPRTRTLDVHVSRLRIKLDLRPERGFLLSALYGRGYQLDYQPVSRKPAEVSGCKADDL